MRRRGGRRGVEVVCVLRGECAVDPLSSLENNVIVVEILDEARRQVGE